MTSKKERRRSIIQRETFWSQICWGQNMWRTISLFKTLQWGLSRTTTIVASHQKKQVQISFQEKRDHDWDWPTSCYQGKILFFATFSLYCSFCLLWDHLIRFPMLNLELQMLRNIWLGFSDKKTLLSNFNMAIHITYGRVFDRPQFLYNSFLRKRDCLVKQFGFLVTRTLCRQWVNNSSRWLREASSSLNQGRNMPQYFYSRNMPHYFHSKNMSQYFYSSEGICLSQ